AALFFCNYKRPVTGANDDLTGCFVSLAVIKYLFDNDIRFEHTDVEVLLAAGEEAGLRGSKAYAKAHKADLDSGIEIAFVGLDTIRDFDHMHIFSGDMNGVVKTDKRVVNLIKEGAEIAGYSDIKIGTINLGSTDSAAMAQAGFAAATFSAMDPAPARYYHTRLDTEENLEPKTIEAGVKIALETTFLFDEKGLG
ncbi:MAG: M20/M25/M40 family metallo-hydrolase, partial [Clostridia bacterium]|nr:M20/M25/M40 family metallo-hydrolase [Clostridia bacterium]